MRTPSSAPRGQRYAPVLASDSPAGLPDRWLPEGRPLILTSHFGRFRAEVATPEAILLARSRMAFSCAALAPAAAAGDDAAQQAPDGAEFRPLRTSYAIDLMTKAPRRLAWGIWGNGPIVTLVQIGPAGDDSLWAGRPRLMPIDASLFLRLANLRQPAV